MAAVEEQGLLQEAKTDVPKRPGTKRILLCGLLAGSILGVDLALPLGVASSMLYVVVVLISLWVPQRSFIIWITAICSVLVLVGLIFSPAGGEMWKIVLNRSLSIFILWATAILGYQRKVFASRHKKAVREHEAALEHVTVLRGMLPICASCKKIRDDQGYWNQIEQYIQAHSEATFTHSLCPKCAVALYPEAASDIDADASEA